jgi:hypothetical protein
LPHASVSAETQRYLDKVGGQRVVGSHLILVIALVVFELEVDARLQDLDKVAIALLPIVLTSKGVPQMQRWFLLNNIPYLQIFIQKY